MHAGAGEIREFIPDVDEALFATMHIAPYRDEDFHADLDPHDSGPYGPRTGAETLVEESNAAVHWMREAGIKWELP